MTFFFNIRNIVFRYILSGNYKVSCSILHVLKVRNLIYNQKSYEMLQIIWCQQTFYV